jgi:molybdopterin-containing oxidoreductase family membrane subunit
MSHLDKVAKLTLVSGLVIAYIYAIEFFIAWYGGDPYERWVFGHRLFGHTYWYAGWTLIGINVCVTQLLWFKKIRANLTALFIIGVLINIGMWTERFVIVVGSLYQDFLPSSWGKYIPTRWDIGLYIGTLGAFFMMYLLFVKFLPMIAIQEVKGATPQGNPHHPLGGAKGGKP